MLSCYSAKGSNLFIAYPFYYSLLLSLLKNDLYEAVKDNCDGKMR
jgi:hypothetical protein